MTSIGQVMVDGIRTWILGEVGCPVLAMVSR